MHPKLLYRAFTKEKYAEQFIEEGKLRFCSLKSYRKNEDPDRVDPLEGYGQIKKSGEKIVVDLENKTLTSVPGMELLEVGGGAPGDYIYCFSNPKSGRISEVPEKFGKYVVKILDPANLFQDISKAVKNDSCLTKNGTIL